MKALLMQLACSRKVSKSDYVLSARSTRSKNTPARKTNPMLKKLFTALLTLSRLTLSACSSSGPKYRNVHSYSEGLAPVQTQGGRWGFVNERQDWVIQPKFEDAREFQGGKAAVRQNGKWGFINKRGEWL